MNKISVVIPTYNRLKILIKTLEAYNSQTIPFKNFQIIIVDDGSTDGTYEYLKNKKYNFELKIYRQKNNGPNSAREKGIKEADYPIILITGDDMIPEKNFLKEHLKTHSLYPQNNIAVLGFIDWHPEVKLDSFKKYITGEGAEQFGYEYLNSNKIKEVDYRFFYTSNISLKKEFINSLDYIFDKDFTYPAYDDIELGIRLQEKGMKIIYNKNATVYHLHNITIKSFGNRSYNSGKMGWLLFNKQPAEEDIKFTVMTCFKNFKTHTDENIQKQLENAAEEINKINPEIFRKIIIPNEKEQIFEKLKFYQKVIFHNFILNRFAIGVFDKINEEITLKEKFNLAIIPETISKNASPSCIRTIFPANFFKIINNVNIFFPQDLNENNINELDTIWVQRSAIFNGNVFDFIKIMKEKGKKIILDIDDLLWEIDDDIYRNFYFKKDLLIKYVDLITLPTEKLKEEVENFYKIPALVIPNFIDTFYFYPKLKTKQRRKLNIGIIGTSSHEQDFNFIAPVIKEIIENYNDRIRIKFWGYIPENLKNIKGVYFIPFEPDYFKYAERLRKESFDFCIVPLLENRINNIKSNIKWLEFSITKIPAIFSDTEPYKCVENLKTGIKIPNNEKDWFTAISLMIEDFKLREDIKNNAYKEVLNNWTLSKNFKVILQKLYEVSKNV